MDREGEQKADVIRGSRSALAGTRRWLYFASAVMFLAVVAALAVVGLLRSRIPTWSDIDSLNVFFLLLSGAATVLALRWSSAAGRSLEVATSSAKTAAAEDLLAVTSPGDILGLIKYNRSQMEAYDTAARAQAERSNLAALWAMSFGGLFLVGGLVVAIQVTDSTSKFTFAGVAALGTVASSYIARTFLVNARAATQTAMYYFQNPLASSYLLTAERVTATLPSAEQSELRAAIIKAAISQADSAARIASPKDVLK